MLRYELCSLQEWSYSAAELFRNSNLVLGGLLRRVREGLGGSHTVVTYPPLDALEKIDEKVVLSSMEPCDDLHVYIHVAFCEYLCQFCHYQTTYTPIDGGRDSVGVYMQALNREIAFWQQHLVGSCLASLYIGGGTPTVVSAERLLALLEVLESFPKSYGFRACLETSPLATVSAGGEQKLSCLVAAGITRVSLGAQTFDAALLPRYRHYELKDLVRAIEIVMKQGVEVNIDLIQDLPHQSDESLLNDLQWIGRIRPHQVTWYILRIHTGSAWFSRLQSGDLELPEGFESARRRAMIREGMRRLGYMCRPGGRFVLQKEIDDHFKRVRCGTEANLLGLGVSSYSHGWGYFFRNATAGPRRSAMGSYLERVNQGSSAVSAGLRITELERIAGQLVAGVRSGVALPDPKPATEEFLADCRDCLSLLSQDGLISMESDGCYRLTEAGSCFEEEICSLFYSPSVKARLRNSNSYWVTEKAMQSQGGVS